MKSGLVFFILKLHQPLQSYMLASHAASVFLGRFFLRWAAATLKGLGEFQNKRIQLTFHHNFQAKNVGFEIQKFQVVWGGFFKICDLLRIYELQYFRSQIEQKIVNAYDYREIEWFFIKVLVPLHCDLTSGNLFWCLLMLS